MDGAQWLAIGRGFHGFGRSTDGAYAPIVPLLATLLETALGPLAALRLLATLTALALSLSVWSVARGTLGPRWGLAAAAVLLPATALAEPIFYGGYPQNLALATGLLALWLACRYLASGSQRDLMMCAAFALVAAAAHHVYYPLALTSIGMGSLIWLSTRSSTCPHTQVPSPPAPSPTVIGEGELLRPGPTPLSQGRLITLATALLPSILLSLVVISQFASKAYVAPLAASARDPGAAWQYSTRESPILWALLSILGLVSLVVSWSSRSHLVWLVSASLIVPTGLAVLATGQPRLLPPLLIGCVIAAAWGASRLAKARRWRPRIGLGFATAAIALVLFLSADHAASEMAHFYQVLDPSLVAAAAAVDHDGATGAVVVRQDRRGWPIGWWIEALLARPIVVGSNPRWLGFPGEMRHAAEADALFDGQLDPRTFERRAAALGGRYLVATKWDWIGWDRWLRRPGFPVSVVYDDDRTIVLRIEPTLAP